MKKKKPPAAAELPGTQAHQFILEARRRMDTGEITPHQFARLMQREAFRTEWTARVQLRAIARDLLPKAAALARKGRARLLALLTKIFLTTETTDLRKMASLYAKPDQTVLLHYVPRPQRNAEERKLEAEAHGEAKLRTSQPRKKARAKKGVVPPKSGRRARAAGPLRRDEKRVEVQAPPLERNSR